MLLYLHGARWNVAGSSPRIRRLHELGFSVLAIDYRGFGKSSAGLPSEESAAEDARAGWDWLGRHAPGRPRFIFGHSLGGAIAIDLARSVQDEAGVMVEATFTSIPDVVRSFRWGWLPVGPLITQRFASIDKVAGIGSPLLVVHGSADPLIPPRWAASCSTRPASPSASCSSKAATTTTPSRAPWSNTGRRWTSCSGCACSHRRPPRQQARAERRSLRRLPRYGQLAAFCEITARNCRVVVLSSGPSVLRV